MFLDEFDHIIKISIHALREEGDSLGQIICHVQIHFYPRPPRGGRLDSRDAVDWHFSISIHALREEGDRLLPLLPSRQ